MIRIWRLGLFIGTVLMFMSLIIMILTISKVLALDLVWDRNPEPDMKQYHVYLCTTPGCKIPQDGFGPFWIGSVPQPIEGVTPFFRLNPDLIGGGAVAAEDQAGNLSGLTTTYNFLSPPLDTAPGTPTNLRVR